MPLLFYPANIEQGSLQERVELLMEGALRYKAIILDLVSMPPAADPKKRTVPRDQVAAYNWEGIARVLREIRELPESSLSDKTKKADLLAKLAEIYEVLRAAKMSKLEAVRLALISEASHLRGGVQVA